MKKKHCLLINEEYLQQITFANQTPNQFLQNNNNFNKSLDSGQYMTNSDLMKVGSTDDQLSCHWQKGINTLNTMTLADFIQVFS